VSFMTSEETIDWQGLLDEFEDFEPEDETCRVDANLFEQSLVYPSPKFIKAFIERKLGKNDQRGEALRSLYFFLLKKRYEERLNLLHFAFKIFDDDTRLPDEVINLTPFPHEDGIPKFKHFSDPNYKLAPVEK
jgi:hypothetical protein